MSAQPFFAIIRADVQNFIVQLGISRDEMVDTLSRPNSTSPYSSLAALTLLAASFPAKSPTSYKPVTKSSSGFEECMPALSAALSSSAIDAGLTYLWSLLHCDSGADDTSVPYENATMLLEVRSTGWFTISSDSRSSLCH